MTEPSVKEIVARLEERICFVGDTGTLGHIDPTELAALIASWREQGEALKPFAKYAERYSDYISDDTMFCCTKFNIGDFRRARAALKDKPLRGYSGEAGAGEDAPL
jgi:hypothetical protein